MNPALPYEPGSVLIIGSGLAGLSTALGIASREPDRPVILATLGRPGQVASSAWAQGGIAAALGADDSSARHVADTITAGAGIVEADAARLIATAIPDRVKAMARHGAPLIERRKAALFWDARPLTAGTGSLR